MTYEQWELVKEECRNERMMAFVALSKEAQEAMRGVERITGAECPAIDVLTSRGFWGLTDNPCWVPGNIYRINPSWPGPSKPEPVAEYEDFPVIQCDGAFCYDPDDYSRVLLSTVCVNPRFAGYVMPDGLLAPCLIFDEQKDGTYRLRVPKAVRLAKEVAK